MDIFRSLLFVPAHLESMVARAAALPADVIVLDLEESVPPEEKAAARACARANIDSIRASGRTVYVRLNSGGGDAMRDDLMTVVQASLNGVILPLADDPQDVRDMDVLLREAEMANGVRPGDTAVITMIESPRGLLRCEEIAQATDRTIGLALGAYDYTAALGVSRTREGTALAHLRYTVVQVAAAYGLLAIDTPYADIADEEGLIAETEFVKAIGYRGKFAVHPRQIEPINRIFSPSAEDVADAQRIVEAFDAAVTRGLGAVSLDKRMIDGPVAERARKTIASAEAIAARDRR